jgi:CRP/FNR family transcriptional regulator, cyclic AMP receptor protein
MASIPRVVDRALLADVDLFRALPPEAVDRVVAEAQPRSLRRGDVLFSEGDEAAELFVVESGRLAMANRSPDGRESVLALMEPGDLFGEMPLFDGQARSADARALEASLVHAVPYVMLREMLQGQPILLWGVVEMLARRLRTMDVALADAVFLDVTGRTAKRLLELAGDAEEFQLPITQEELAGLVGASRERVNKAISSFIRLGWIDQRDRRYRILNREQLSIRSR